MNRFGLLDPLDQISDALPAEPKSFHAGFSVALAPEKPAQADHPADHITLHFLHLVFERALAYQTDAAR
jgi:hypothetical protein